MSSVEGHRTPPPGSSVYAATKAASECFTRAWALELGQQGIRVNAVAPGVTLTGAGLRAGFTEEQVRMAQAVFAEATVAGRVGEPPGRWPPGSLISLTRTAATSPARSYLLMEGLNLSACRKSDAGDATVARCEYFASGVSRRWKDI